MLRMAVVVHPPQRDLRRDNRLAQFSNLFCLVSILPQIAVEQNDLGRALLNLFRLREVEVGGSNPLTPTNNSTS